MSERGTLAAVPPPRRPGRPRLDASDASDTVSVHVRLPARQYDAVYDAAQAARVSVPELIRRRVQHVDDDDDDDQ
jgi:hypothetical protein